MASHYRCETLGDSEAYGKEYNYHLVESTSTVSIYTSLDMHGTMANIYKFKNAKSANMEIHKI